MNPECERIRQWLDEVQRRPLPPDLEAHAASCPSCRASVGAEQALREHLSATAPLDPARRTVLMEGILTASAAAPRVRRMRLLRWSWVPLAAAAAIVLAVFLGQPQKPRTPISPTEVFGDFLGPMANFVAPAETPQQTPGKEPSTTDDILAAFWGDLEGPLTVALASMEAPRAAAGIEPAAQNPKPQAR